jgi:hypothetical protein
MKDDDLDAASVESTALRVKPLDTNNPRLKYAALFLILVLIAVYSTNFTYLLELSGREVRQASKFQIPWVDLQLSLSLNTTRHMQQR